MYPRGATSGERDLCRCRSGVASLVDSAHLTQLFNLDNDAEEQKNLFDTESEIASSMQALLNTLKGDAGVRALGSAEPESQK